MWSTVKKCVAALLRGLADAEGSAGKEEENFGRISIANTDRQLTEYAQLLLSALGIIAKIYKHKGEGSCKHRWRSR